MHMLITKLSDTSIRPSPSFSHFLKEWMYITKELLTHSLVPGFFVTTNVLYLPATALSHLKVSTCLRILLLFPAIWQGMQLSYIERPCVNEHAKKSVFSPDALICSKQMFAVSIACHWHVNDNVPLVALACISLGM